MFSIHQLSEQIGALLENRLEVDEFEEWFVANSWGYYQVGADSLSKAIAAVHHVLHAYQSDEIEERDVAQELDNAIRPFEHSPVIVADACPSGLRTWVNSASMGTMGTVRVACA